MLKLIIEYFNKYIQIISNNKILCASLILSIFVIQFSCSNSNSKTNINNIKYKNLFKELLGKNNKQIKTKINKAWDHLFYGHDDYQRVYYPVGDDMAYIMDIGNNDVRSEGMSYGMMIAVQLDKKEEFDRIWKWTKKYMYQDKGPYKGYFAWHCTSKGEKIDQNPASDGEEWFVTALFFAEARWGNGEGIFNYGKEANDILHTMLHKEESGGRIAKNMFNSKHKQIVFVPNGLAAEFTDPSYHLPHFYELWASWADKDNDFWKEAAAASREFFKKTAHPKTGLMPDYAKFSGTPTDPFNGGHDVFRFDSWRNGMNVAVDYAWFSADKWAVKQSNRLLNFFYNEGIDSYVNQYTLDGKRLSKDHSLGLISMNAVACLAATISERKKFVEKLWNAFPPEGKWRYYDGLLYMLALLNVSGNFKVYIPK
jgi:oligosaccharide reducing-end xylanase